MVDALFDAGIAFEISSRYWPHERLVRRAIDAACGSRSAPTDTRVEQVGEHQSPARRLVRALGVADVDLYDPERHGSKPRRRALDA